MRSQSLYEFDRFRLDPHEGLLLSDGRRVRLEPKDLEILLVLVENHGHTVGKEELFERIWPGTFVEEGNLARHISVLRQVLGQAQGGDTKQVLVSHGSSRRRSVPAVLVGVR